MSDPQQMLAGMMQQPQQNRKPSPEEMKKLRQIGEECNFAQDYLNDMGQEDGFLKLLEGKKPGEVQVETELDLMIKVYNEQLDGLVRLRFDIEIHDMLIKKQPNDIEHVINKAKAVLAIQKRRVAISALRKQILELNKHGKEK